LHGAASRLGFDSPAGRITLGNPPQPPLPEITIRQRIMAVCQTSASSISAAADFF